MPKVIRAIGRGQPAHFNLEDVAAQASDCLARAQTEAQHIVAQAHDDAAAIRQQAEAAGRSAAAQAIEDMAEQRVDERLVYLQPALAKTLEEFQSARFQWLAHWEKQAVHLAISIAGRVIRRELTTDPEIPLELVREALHLAAGSARMRLSMNPADADALAAPLRRFLADVAASASITLVADPAISRGGCRVETEHGSVDQQFEAQLSRIAEELE